MRSAEQPLHNIQLVQTDEHVQHGIAYHNYALFRPAYHIQPELLHPDQLLAYIFRDGVSG